MEIIKNIITDMRYFHAVESRLIRHFSLKWQQRDVIPQLCSGIKTVFAFWPTGFGKSALFMITPLLLDEVE